ncbi:MAG: hypothetical protein K940chlam1_00701 [Candidatus Anoxychlamydiales bacterium]|nr:hypothetical protein [Candidatus Anoxychlamydiales bacterium]NGX35790.1 hypothetical protein [Candidatus Anoxychlamydiales bacterium]
MSAFRPTNLKETTAITYFGYNFEKLKISIEEDQQLVIEVLFEIIKDRYADKWQEYLIQNHDECLEQNSLKKRGIKKVDSNDFEWMKLVVDMYFKQNPQVIVQIKINLNLLKDAEKLADRISNDDIREQALKNIAFAYLKLNKEECALKETLRLADKVSENKVALEMLCKTQERHVKLYHRDSLVIDNKIRLILIKSNSKLKKLEGTFAPRAYRWRVNSC